MIFDMSLNKETKPNQEKEEDLVKDLFNSKDKNFYQLGMKELA